MKRFGFSNIKKGDVVSIDTDSIHNEWSDIVEFIGFSDIEQKYGESGPKFDTLKDLKAHYNVRSVKALEALADEKEYGHVPNAIMRPVDGSQTYMAYLYNGKWCLGSGGMPAIISKIN